MKLNYLKEKLAKKRPRALTRYKYYDMKNGVKDLNIATPTALKAWMSSLGWCASAVDSLADRLSIYDFKNDVLDMKSIFMANNDEILFDSAILGALITSCDFFYIHKNTDGSAAVEIVDGSNATGIINPHTYMLEEGYAVLRRDEAGNAVIEAHFLPGQTVFYEKGRVVSTETYNCLYPCLVPIMYRPDSTRPFGHSRISRACMDLQDSAVRTLKRSEITAEFYSFPQKYILGIDPDAADAMDNYEKWRMTIASILGITSDSNGEKPTVGQFQQASAAPHIEQLRMFASAFAGETGLTIDDMGFPSDNPSSAEAIKASHEKLRLKAIKAQKVFSICIKNAGVVAASVYNNKPISNNVANLTRVLWEPVFTPDASALSIIGDGAIKTNNAIPGYFDKENMRELTGIEAAQPSEE